jgi:type IV pilus assembly protein PilA
MQERGFSLIELLIVIAVILVISAIAVPSLLHSKLAANEASAVYSIRTINTAQVTYATTYPTVGYAASLNMLASPVSGQSSSANAGVLDWILGCTTAVCPKTGYDFQLYNVSGSPTINAYSVSGVPTSIGVTGNRGFCSDNMNPVNYSTDGGIANCNLPLQ